MKQNVKSIRVTYTPDVIFFSSLILSGMLVDAPHKLLKKYETEAGEKACHFVECLGNMSVAGEDDTISFFIYQSLVQ